jgi:hypothetical protein
MRGEDPPVGLNAGVLDPYDFNLGWNTSGVFLSFTG